MTPSTLGGFLMAALAVTVICWLSYSSFGETARTSRNLATTIDVMSQLQGVFSTLKDAETGQRGYLLTGRESYLEPFSTAKEALPGEIRSLHQVLDGGGNAEQGRRLDVLQTLAAEKMAELDQTVELKRAGRTDAALEIVLSDRGRNAMNRIRAVIADMLDAERRQAAAGAAESRRASTQSYWITWGGSGLLALLILVAAVVSSRDFRARQLEAWLRNGQLRLADVMQGDQPLDRLGLVVLSFLAEYLGAQVGALFVAESGHFRRVAGYALPANGPAEVLRPGDGLAGQAVRERRPLRVRQVPADYLPIESGVGRGSPGELLIAPVGIDGLVYAVVELGFFGEVDDAKERLLSRVSESVAVAVRASRDRTRLEELLQETQQQGEELQTREEELRVNNEELEEQGRTLKESRAQLESQQAELEQINSQLEEQAEVLEHQRDALAHSHSVLSGKTDELRRANEYKSEFLANMSHELRTPLNSTLILAKLLADNKEGNLTDQQVKFAQTISSAGNDLLTLINDVLDLSRIESGKVEVTRERFAVADLLDSLSKLIRPAAEQKKLGFSVTVDPEVPSHLETDSQRLSQILKNLLSNAVKFTEKGAVGLRAHRDLDGCVSFTVKDTGSGIPLHQQDVIFEAFRQADGSIHRKYGGTGLGLSISRDLARLLGGSIAVRSAPGEGSEFTLTLPIRYVPAASGESAGAASAGAGLAGAAGSAGAASAGAGLAGAAGSGGGSPGARLAGAAASAGMGSAGAGSPGATGLAGAESLGAGLAGAARSARRGSRGAAGWTGATAFETEDADSAPRARPPAIEDDRASLGVNARTILVVEDDASFALILRDLAREMDFQCIVEQSASEGLAAAVEFRPSAILLDINLPDHSGLSVLNQLKHDPRTRHIPVHVASVADYRREALELGAVGYALKPVKRSELVDALQRLESKLAQSLRRVLIVEDDLRQRDSLRELLANGDVHITAVETAADALEQLKHTTFDCMVMDFNLPDYSGYDLLEKMSRQDDVGFPPVIVYTGRALSQDEEQRLRRYSKSIIIKDARSPERLLDEVTLFLHQVESKLPPERQQMLRVARSREASLEGRCILVVEDDVRNIFALTSVLEPRGARVEIARNGREAIDALARAGVRGARRIDLVLMDVMMPEMDGLTAMREIRKRSEWKKLPIIALTAKAMKDDQEECLAAGASDYIAKPLDVEKLLSLVRVWMQK